MSSERPKLKACHRRGRGCEQRRQDHRQTKFNEKTVQSLSHIDITQFQQQQNYTSFTDYCSNTIELPSRTFCDFGRIKVATDQLACDSNGSLFVADTYECSCSTGDGFCTPDFCIKNSTMRILPPEVDTFGKVIGFSDYFDPMLCAAQDAILANPTPEMLRNPEFLEILAEFRSEEVKHPQIPAEVSLPSTAVIPPPASIVKVKCGTSVCVPVLPTDFSNQIDDGEFSVGTNVQFIYSGPGCGKSTFKKKYPAVYDTNDEKVLPSNGIVLTDRLDLLCRYPQPYHIIHLPRRRVWKERCISVGCSVSDDIYERLSKHNVFFKMRSDKYLSDLLSIVTNG